MCNWLRSLRRKLKYWLKGNTPIAPVRTRLGAFFSGGKTSAHDKYYVREERILRPPWADLRPGARNAEFKLKRRKRWSGRWREHFQPWRKANVLDSSARRACEKLEIAPRILKAVALCRPCKPL